ncbi:MAG: type III secretion system chaperone [Elainellaceae cyanobacterium]
MTPDDITAVLTDLFGEDVQAQPPETWQVESDRSRLLVLVSEDQSWLRALVSIAPEPEAQPFLAQLLEANFDDTQEARYALYQNVLWGIFQHALPTLTADDFKAALARLVILKDRGIGDSFNRLAETQIRQIVQAAKQQGQSLEATLQTLERFYQEGVMGEMEQSAEQRESVMEAWRYQLKRLWDE